MSLTTSQAMSQLMSSTYAPVAFLVLISAVILTYLKFIKNDPKKREYKPIPGPKGK